MNRIYKTLWSASTQSWQAVPENARTGGKKSTSSAVGVVASVALSWVLTSGAHAQSPPAINQLPTNGVVARGTATIQQTATAQAAAMTVNQSSQRAVINWDTFNLGSKASVNFVQPNAQAVTLNRVNDSNPSQIFGRITANGQVFLTNANGVYFSPTSSVDVGAFTATTHGISDDNFMSGKYVFERNGATGKVVNEGNINAALGGYVALLAPEVQNAGVVVARAGTVAMAAGEMITLTVDNNGSLAGITTTPSTIATLVENKHAVLAPDGQIILSAVALDKLQAGVIKNSGSLEANSISRKGGKIYLEGDDITLTSTSKIEAKGPAGGGTVLIGGDWQGSGSLRQATKVTMEAGASIDASATDNGDGGKVVLWSDVHNADSVTQANGSIKAEAGPNGGDGGKVETSGHALKVDGIQVSTKALQGGSGNWLLDPYDVTISTAATSNDTLSSNVYTPSANSSVINNGDLQTALGNGNVEIVTTGTGGQLGKIIVASDISWSNASTLTLTAANTITGTSGKTITIGTNGTLVLNPGSNSTFVSNIAGNGNFKTAGARTIYLTGTNTYTGTTTVSGLGWLTVGEMVAGSVGSIGTGEVIVNSGTYINFNLTGTNTYSNNISGAGGVYATGGGTSILTGVITYTGPTSMISSTIAIGNGGTGGAGIGAVSFNSSSDLLIVNLSNNFTISGVISGSGSLKQAGTGTTTLTGTNTYTGTTTISAGTVQIGAGGTTGSLGSGAVTDNGTLSFNRSDAITVSNNISGSGSLTQAGTGTTTLAGTNSYGATTISAGTLEISGTLGAGLVTDNATLFINRSAAYSLSGIASYSSGITGTGNIKIQSTGGALTIDRNISLTGASSRIDLLSHSLAAANNTVDDLTIGAGTMISTSNTGTIVISSGTANTAALMSSMSGATGSTKYKTYNATASTALSGAVTGTINFYYRQRPVSQTVTGLTITATKVYDKTTSAAGATFTQTGGSVATGIDGDSFTASVSGGTFSGSNVGATLSSATFSSTSANSGWSLAGYSFNCSGCTYSGTITPKAVTVGGLSVASSRAYNGTLVASVSGSPSFVSEAAGAGSSTDGNIYTGDTVTYSGSATGTYNYKDVSTASLVTFGGLTSTNPNYTLTFGTQAATITPKALTVSGLTSASSRVYDGTLSAVVSGTPSLLTSEPAGTGSSTDGKIYGTDSVTFSGTATGTYNGKDVATANTVTFGGLTSSNTNYTLTLGTQTATITPKAVTVSGLLVPTSRVYDGTVAATVSGTPSLLALEAAGSGSSSDGKIYTGDSVTLNGTASGAYNTKDVATANLVTFSGLTSSNSNYTLSLGTQAASISAKTLTMDGLSVASSKVYDGTQSATVSGTAALLAASTAGSGTSSDGKPYAVDSVSISGTATGTYNSKDVATANSVTFAGLSLAGGQAGNYTLTIQSPASATITTKALTVTASNDSKTYNGLSYTGGNGVTYAGFENSENSSVLSGSVSYSGSSQGAINAGSYAITPGGLSSSNYAITFANGALTVNKASATVTANSATTTYTGLAQSVSGFTASGLVNGETETELTGVTAGVTRTNAGTYASTASGTDSNYNLSFVNGTFTINKANLTKVMASKTYDGLSTVSATQVTAIEGVNGETFTASAGIASINDKNVLTANKTLTDLSGLTLVGNSNAALSANYNLGSNLPVAGANNQVTIDAKALGLSIPGATRVYDSTTVISPSGPVTLSGIVGFDIVNLGTGNVTGFVDKNVGTNKTVTYTGLALSGNDAGNYALPVNPTSNANITPAALSISGITVADKTYDAGTTATVSTAHEVKTGLIGNDVVNVAATGSFTDKNVGTAKTVNLSSSYSGADAGNYTVTDQATTTASITPAPLTVKAQDALKNFGSANPTFSATVSGYVGGETAATSGVTGVGSATSTATALTDAGAAVITAGVGSLSATNYAFTRFVDGTLTIRSISVMNNAEVSTLIGAQLANLTSAQVGSFSATQLQVFSPQQLSALSPSQLAGLTNAQLLYLSPDQIAAISPARIASMTPDQLAGLSVSQVTGLTTSQLQVLSAAQIAVISTAQLGQLSSAQISALTSNAAASLSFQQIAALAPTQIVGVDAARVASLTAAEIGSLSDAQLQALSLLQIAAIAPDHFSALSPAQIMALSITQVINLTPDQLRGFSPAQVASLSAAELAYFDARQLAAIGIVPKTEAPVAQAPVPTPAEVPSVEAPVPPAIATSNQLPLNFETPNAPIEQVAASATSTANTADTASTASDADANDARNKFQAAIPVMTAVAGANASAAVPAAAPTPIAAGPTTATATTAVTATAQQPAATTAQAAPAAGAAQSSPSVTLTVAASQSGVLAITILSNAEPRPTTVGVAFEQDGNVVTLRTASAPPTPPVSDRFTFSDKLTSFMVSSDSGGLVEFKASLVNRRLVILAQSSAARQIARNEMNVVLAAAITSLGAENRVMLANLDGVVLDLR